MVNRNGMVCGTQRESLASCLWFATWCVVICTGRLWAQRGGDTSLTDSLALGKDAYMVRLTDSLSPASYGNDGDLKTAVHTTTRTVDGYWEVDLEELYAIDQVLVLAANGLQDQMTHATVRLFDGEHKSIYSKPLDNVPASSFLVDCRGPRRARYVRVGFEYKERSSPTGGIEWHLGLKEVIVLGQPASAVGLLSFSASATHILPGEAVTLAWQVEGATGVSLYSDQGQLPLDTAVVTEGVATLPVTPTKSQEYTLIAEGTFGRDIQSLCVTVDEAPLPLRINELVAKNRLSLEDGTGRSPDWIELYNPASDPVTLTGYGLSDDPTRPLKWQFPEAVIEAHSTLVIFASGQTAPWDTQGHLHTPWRLNSDSESVVLSNPQGVVLDAILDYPALCEDLAYGRGMDQVLTFMDPTPGEINLSDMYQGWLAPVVFGVERGFYQDAFHLTLSHPDPTARIRISEGGTVLNSTYHRPIRVGGTQTLRAQVTREGYKSPRIQTHTYLFIEDVANAPVMSSNITQDSRYRTRLRKGLMDLPSLSIAVPTQPDDYREFDASVELLWPDGNTPVQANCSVMRYGGAWTSFAKKNYRLKFRKAHGTPKFKAPLFRGFEHGVPALESFDELELGGGSHDMAQRGFYMAARFVEDSALDMGTLNPHGRFVHLYINGVYWGQYHLRERLVRECLADSLGGEEADYLNIRGNDNVGSGFVPGTPDPVNRDTWNRIREFSASYEQVRAYLDIDSLIDFMLVWFYGDCESEYRAAGPVEAGSGVKFWMADSDGFLRVGALNKGVNNQGPGNLFGRLVSEGHPDFMTRLADRIYQHLFNDGALTPARTTARLQMRMDEIQDSLVAECARWGYRSPNNWQAAAENVMETLFPQRADRLVNSLRARNMYPDLNPPTFSSAGGSVPSGYQVTFAAAPGTVYYTTDGSDPRAAGGGISASARQFIGDLASRLVTLVGADTGVQALVPTRDLGSSWRMPDTVPSDEWLASTGSGVGYDLALTYEPYLDLSLESQMFGVHTTLYARYTFNVTDAGIYSGLTLGMRYDDGYAAYLNGVLIARGNAPSSLAWDSAALGSRSDSEALVFQTAFLENNSPEQLLRTGANVLAIQGLNRGTNSSDMLIEPQLKAVESLTDTTSSPLQLDRATLIRARCRSGSTWSAITQAYYVINQAPEITWGDLAVTALQSSGPDHDDQEYLVLTNVSDHAVNLRHARFTEGVGYAFSEDHDVVLASGQDFTLVKSLFHFQQHHGIDVPVAGQYSGRLNDAGETLVLVDGADTVLLRHVY
ncbi:MAG: hypothetical protein GY809_17610 [Planctomycetes bacterium]|nr:hypothetical protein [Planctomycetota bacterium]